MTRAIPSSRAADRRLLRQLSVAVLLKLLVLVALWWFFVREQRVAVDAAAVAAQQVLPGAPTDAAASTAGTTLSKPSKE